MYQGSLSRFPEELIYFETKSREILLNANWKSFYFAARLGSASSYCARRWQWMRDSEASESEIYVDVFETMTMVKKQ